MLSCEPLTLQTRCLFNCIIPWNVNDKVWYKKMYRHVLNQTTLNCLYSFVKTVLLSRWITYSSEWSCLSVYQKNRIIHIVLRSNRADPHEIREIHCDCFPTRIPPNQGTTAPTQCYKVCCSHTGSHKKRFGKNNIHVQWLWRPTLRGTMLSHVPHKMQLLINKTLPHGRACSTCRYSMVMATVVSEVLTCVFHQSPKVQYVPH